MFIWTASPSEFLLLAIQKCGEVIQERQISPQNNMLKVREKVKDVKQEKKKEFWKLCRDFTNVGMPLC